MVTALETEWTRPAFETQIGLEDFKNILRTRIETVVFKSYFTAGTLSATKTYDDLGREQYKIIIDSDDPEIEQAITLVHEIAHIHYKSPYANLVIQLGVRKDEKEDKYEEFIEEETERFFAENSDSIMQTLAFLHLADNVSKGHPFGVIS